MKRLRKTTALSAFLSGLSVLAIVLAFYAGNLLFGIAGVVLLAIALAARKRESYNEYRDRYDEKYGMKDPEE
jgi:hypothetical protein